MLSIRMEGQKEGRWALVDSPQEAETVKMIEISLEETLCKTLIESWDFCLPGGGVGGSVLVRA